MDEVSFSLQPFDAVGDRKGISSVKHLKDEDDAVPSNVNVPTKGSSIAQVSEPVQEDSTSRCVSTEANNKPKYFDIFMIHREKDEDKMLKLRDILRRFVTLSNDRRLTFGLQEIGVPFTNVKFDHFEKSMQRSRYKFIYVGVDFNSESCDIDDDAFQWQLNQHYALNEMIRKRDKSVVPVTDNPRTRIPTLLDIFRPLDVWKLLRQRSLDDVSGVSDLDDGDVNQHTVDFIRRMFDPNALPTPRVYNTPEHIKRLRANYALLTEKMDADSGLLAELFAKEVITHREMENIKAGNTFYDRNEKLLDVMLRKTNEKFQQFVEALATASMTELADALKIDS